MYVPNTQAHNQMINYNGRTFKPVANIENGETSPATQFVYLQEGNIVTTHYRGGQILQGHLIALVGEDGSLDMRYHQVNSRGELMIGLCRSVPELLENGKLRLHETWQWTSGDRSSGSSILEEV